MMAMAREENRQSKQAEYGYQAASPPAILPQHLALETVEPSGERFLPFSPLASASWFFSHRLLPLRLCAAGASRWEHGPCPESYVLHQ